MNNCWGPSWVLTISGDYGRATLPHLSYLQISTFSLSFSILSYPWSSDFLLKLIGVQREHGEGRYAFPGLATFMIALGQ